jgi:hypothetical protein
MDSFSFIKHLLFGLEIIGGLRGDYEAFNAKWVREKDETQNISRLNTERIACSTGYSLIY